MSQPERRRADMELGDLAFLVAILAIVLILLLFFPFMSLRGFNA